MNGGGAEREGDTESEAGSRLQAVSPEPDAGLELTDREIVTQAEVGCLTDRAAQVPLEGSSLRKRLQVVTRHVPGPFGGLWKDLLSERS